MSVEAALAGSVVSGLFNKRSADKQMRFQDTQSRTQYQRAVADMRAAGLNPMLAAKLGSNAAMSGAMATMPDLGSTVNSATSIANQKPVQDTQAALNRAQAKVASMTYSQIEAQIGQIMANTDNIEVKTALAKLNVREQRLLVMTLETAKALDPEAYKQLKFGFQKTILDGLIETSVNIENAMPTAKDVTRYLMNLQDKGVDVASKLLEMAKEFSK
jgi:hypothetical protein